MQWQYYILIFRADHRLDRLPVCRGRRLRRKPLEEQQVVMWPGQGAGEPIPGGVGLELWTQGDIGRPISRVRPETKGVLAASCLSPGSERGNPAPLILGDDRTAAIVDGQLGKLHRGRAPHRCKPAQGWAALWFGIRRQHSGFARFSFCYSPNLQPIAPISIGVTTDNGD